MTRFKEFDVHFPAIGPVDIVFENAGRLYLLDLPGEKLHEVEIEVVTDRATLKPRAENVAKLHRQRRHLARRASGRSSRRAATSSRCRPSTASC